MFNAAVGTRCGPTAEHASCCGPCTCAYMRADWLVVLQNDSSLKRLI